MCTYVEKLYKFLDIPPKEEIICNTLSGKCLSIIGDCQACGVAIKKSKCSLTEHQQFELIKAFLTSLQWRFVSDLPSMESYEEGLAELILKHWEEFQDHTRDIIIKVMVGLI